MQPEPYNKTWTEAVAVFHDARSIQAAIDELLTAGFDHAEISVLASERVIRETLGHDYRLTSDLEDDPDVPKVGYVPNESVGDAQGGIIAVAAYFPAVIGSFAVAVSGGTLLGAIAVAAVAGGAGATVGAVLARFIGNAHARHMDEHLSHGGLLLWVRTHDAQHEEKALAILRRHSGEDLHLHTMTPPTRKPQSIPLRQPAISFGPPT
jgi:hypothetical protein